MKSGIYAIVNSINGRRYYGSTIHLTTRKRQHWRSLQNNKHINRHLQSAWNLYGESAFYFLIIEYIPTEMLLDVEQRYLNTNIDGYNLAKYADAAGRGAIRSPETREKIRIAKTGLLASKETKQKMSASHKARTCFYKHTAESKAKISASKMGSFGPNNGKHLSLETRAKISIATIGRPSPFRGCRHSKETKEKMRSLKKGKPLSAEHRAKLALAGIGRITSEETKEKIRAHHMGHPVSAETREKLRLANLGKKKSFAGHPLIQFH